MDESILVMDNISSEGFRSGPRLQLDLPHFQVMMKTIAEYHSLTYAMRIAKDPRLEQLKSGLITLAWVEPDKTKHNFYNTLYGIAFERLFAYVKRKPDSIQGTMKQELNAIRTRFLDEPSAFLEMFREDDPLFSVILHGDYNRNNVLYKYNEETGDPEELRMIDFQEVRYASPAIDIFFLLYMSSTPELRESHWDELIKLYHSTIITNLVLMLDCKDETDPRLEPYSYANFQRHFARFAFYGMLVTLQFLPWMDSPNHECEALSAEFERDMTSEKFRVLATEIGGDSSNEKVIQGIQHASKMGYLKFLTKDA